ncbi:MAG: lamin tail domain-containing protein [Ignavibacteriaceae bacterium]
MKSLLLRIFFFIAISANLSFAQVLMNEIYSRGVPANPDWIEIYNGTSAAIDITGYKIYDGGGNAGTKPKKLFPAGSVVPANGFLVIVVDDADASGFGLSSGGDEVWLEDGTGNVIDHTLVPAMPDVNTSFSRVPDGSANWVITNTITKGTANIFTTDVTDEISNPVAFSLSQNFPNPFNPTTSIKYDLTVSGFTTLQVYDVLGNGVATLVSSEQNAGSYQLEFNAASLSSGIYFYKLTSGNFTAVKKLNLLK